MLLCRRSEPPFCHRPPRRPMFRPPEFLLSPDSFSSPFRMFCLVLSCLLPFPRRPAICLLAASKGKAFPDISGKKGETDGAKEGSSDATSKATGQKEGGTGGGAGGGPGGDRKMPGGQEMVGFGRAAACSMWCVSVCAFVWFR